MSDYRSDPPRRSVLQRSIEARTWLWITAALAVSLGILLGLAIGYEC